MNGKIASTRGNLIRISRSLLLAQKGHDLLEQKRQILMMELVRHIEEAKVVQKDMAQVFSSAYKALERANISLGIDAVEEVAHAIPEEARFIIRLRSVMGVEVPEVDELEGRLEPSYSFFGTSGALDEAYLAFRQVLHLLSRLAEVETSIYRLAFQIRKTHRRVEPPRLSSGVPQCT
ncbi:MAG: V-type ATP synthase subunit D [Synergistales bacterium 54_24]|nr:MAG: V-type ATP synthase subunit D [Synergistales bacterium 54_24]HAF49664.1 V-type ATP synthase subunit D [Synergistaceae bacterium]